MEYGLVAFVQFSVPSFQASSCFEAHLNHSHEVEAFADRHCGRLSDRIAHGKEHPLTTRSCLLCLRPCDCKQNVLACSAPDMLLKD